MTSVTMPKSFAKVAATPVIIPHRPPTSKSPTQPASSLTPSPATQSSAAHLDTTTHISNTLADSVSHMALSGAPSLIINGFNLIAKTKSAGESDDSHPTDSSDIGTKPPSLDGKSVTSGTMTTFAMDEKDSLRPDDSASVQAAADDDDASIRGSLIAGSRALASESRVPAGPRVVGIEGQMAVMSNQPSAQVVPPVNPLENIYQQAPDEKLLEAIKSVKDRQFLLRLEVDVINFVQESKEPFMDLPPSNSFFRMLTHKLADYYHMTHSYEKDHGPGFVRIFRTPFCRVPPSLASIAASTRSSSPPAIMPMKIMRRGEEIEPALSSASQSKAASEVGSDQKEKVAIKERKTREEREEAYNEARKRIFGASAAITTTTTTTTTTSTPIPDELASETADTENGMSRASSVSAKDKSAVGAKRGKINKQRRDSVGFESRNSYVQQWSHPQTWGQPQYVPIGQVYQGPLPSQASYPPQMAGLYNGPQGPDPQAPSPSPGPGPGYTGPGYMQPGPLPGRYPQIGPPPMPNYGPNSGAPPQQWQQYNQQNYRQPQQYGRPAPAPPPPAVGPNGVPYPFGQLPVNMNPYDVKSQHPIPGSYNRNGFNPKTQSFIPNTGNPVGQPQQQLHMYQPGPSHHMSPRMDHYGPFQHSPQMNNAQAYTPNYPMGQPIGPPPVPVPMPINTYGLPPQGHHYPGPPMQTIPPNGPNGPNTRKPMPQANVKPPGPSPQIMEASPSGKALVVDSNAATSQHFGGGNLAHYGNPATLPQKPT